MLWVLRPSATRVAAGLARNARPTRFASARPITPLVVVMAVAPTAEPPDGPEAADVPPELGLAAVAPPDPVAADPVPALLPFFFQAEDGIRDLIVTGVQTCALPI